MRVEAVYKGDMHAVDFISTAPLVHQSIFFLAFQIGWWCLDCHMVTIDTKKKHAMTCTKKKVDSNNTRDEMNRGYIHCETYYRCMACGARTQNLNQGQIEHHLEHEHPAECHALIGAFPYWHRVKHLKNYFKPHPSEPEKDRLKSLCRRHIESDQVLSKAF